jgi:2,4-dienoyl-CoA reductase-like NADH-dependent reductase (Old Yellow Enzyme family)
MEERFHHLAFWQRRHQEKYISFVKGLTTKPVVGVGRYTSPDSMVSAIERGVMDMIGAARPSIADPFLPNKIKEGGTKTSASASAVISVSQVIRASFRFAARKTRRWGKNGGASGILRSLRRKNRR